MEDIEKLREDLIKKWNDANLLKGLKLYDGDMPLFEPTKFIVNFDDLTPKKSLTERYGVKNLFPISKKVFATTINIKDMENLNEIKKLLYKEKPIAVKNNELSTSTEFVYKCDITGMTYLHENFITFNVPVSDMGDAKFGEEEPAQLLIRWISNITT